MTVTPADAQATQKLLLDGVRAFRAERYTEALEIFRRVEGSQPPQDIGFYLGMVLHKLGRHGEALPAFRAAHRSGLREPVADYYRAVSCYRLGLLARARKDFQAMLTKPGFLEETGQPVLGPRLQEGAQRFLQTIEQTLADAGPAARIPALLRRYEAALLHSETLLSEKAGEEALEWLEEAVQWVVQMPERQAHMPKVRQVMLRLRETLQGKPAELDVRTLWASLGSGNPL